jgi:hypothetical protein
VNGTQKIYFPGMVVRPVQTSADTPPADVAASGAANTAM